MEDPRKRKRPVKDGEYIGFNVALMDHRGAPIATAQQLIDHFRTQNDDIMRNARQAADMAREVRDAAFMHATGDYGRAYAPARGSAPGLVKDAFPITDAKSVRDFAMLCRS